jgi:hypothetical protein
MQPGRACLTEALGASGYASPIVLRPRAARFGLLATVTHYVVLVLFNHEFLF